MKKDIAKIELAHYSDIDFFIRKYHTDHPLSSLHYHEFLQLNFVSQGECIHYLEGKEYTVKKGDVFVIPPKVSHCIRQKDNCTATIYELEFTPDFINTSLIVGNRSLDTSNNIFWDFAYLSPFMVEAQNVHPGFTLPISVQNKIKPILDDMLYEYTERDSGFEYVLSGHTLSLLIFIGREYKKALNLSERSDLYITKKQNILDAIEYINTHYKENLTVNEVAKCSYLSPSYFKSLFKYFTSKTFVEYLNDVRISRAALLLRQTDMKVIDIAYETGFNYVNHFNRVFKQTMNITPIQYRKNNLK